MGLNVLQISESDLGGGAARSAYTIHRALNQRGHASRMLVGRRLGDEPEIRSIKRGAGWRAADRIAGEVLDPLGLQYAFYPSSFAVAADSWFRWADIVQLHNTHGSYFSHTALPLLSRSRPVVWLLHDMWALTGHVTYSYDCERWRTGCGSCPYLRSYPALPRDTTALLWRLKRSVYRRARLTIVAPSRWLADLARESPLLGRFPVHHIPHGIDPSRYAPGDRAGARRRLGLPVDRKVVGFVAADVGDERKGFRLLEAAVAALDHHPILLAVGANAVDTALEHRTFEARDEATLADAYRAADVVVLPTLADNFPNVLLESMACGTPCVGFDVGGLPDAIRDGESGFVVPPVDVRRLTAALSTILEDDALRRRLGEGARALVEREYTLDRQVARYVELYERLAA